MVRGFVAYRTSATRLDDARYCGMSPNHKVAADSAITLLPFAGVRFGFGFESGLRTRSGCELTESPCASSCWSFGSPAGLSAGAASSWAFLLAGLSGTMLHCKPVFFRCLKSWLREVNAVPHPLHAMLALVRSPLFLFAGSPPSHSPPSILRAFPPKTAHRDFRKGISTLNLNPEP